MIHHDHVSNIKTLSTFGITILIFLFATSATAALINEEKVDETKNRGSTRTSSVSTAVMKHENRLRQLHVGPHAPVPLPTIQPVTANPSEYPSSVPSYIPTSINMIQNPTTYPRSESPSYLPSIAAPILSNYPSNSPSDSPSDVVTALPSFIAVGVTDSSDKNGKTGNGKNHSSSVSDEKTDGKGGKGKAMMM